MVTPCGGSHLFIVFAWLGGTDCETNGNWPKDHSADANSIRDYSSELGGELFVTTAGCSRVNFSAARVT